MSSGTTQRGNAGGPSDQTQVLRSIPRARPSVLGSGMQPVTCNSFSSQARGQVWGLEQTEGGSKAVGGAPPAHGYQGCRQDTEGARHAGWWRLNPPGKKEGG